MGFDLNKLGKNLKYHVNVHYDYEIDQDEHEYCDYICRCSMIINAKTESDLEQCIELVNSFYQGQEIEKVIAARYLYHVLTEDDFRIEIERGYYGEEVGGVYFDDLSKFKEFDKTSSVKEKLELWLTKEYGYVLPEISQINDWELRNLLLRNVTDNTNKELDQETINNLTEKIFVQSKKKKYANKNNGRITVYSGPVDQFASVICLPVQNTTEQYKIVDGRHRFHAYSKYPKYSYKNMDVITPRYIYAIVPKNI